MKRKEKQNIDVFTLLNRLFVTGAYATLLVSGYHLITYYWESYDAQGTQKEIRHVYAVQAQHVSMEWVENTGLIVTSEDITEKPQKELVFRDEMSEFYETNSDTVGYIKIPNTGLDGVVVQGDDDEYYLTHNFYQEKRQCGTLFVDSRCTINTYADSPNLIIYGHNQYDGTMFGDMDFYRWNLDYWLSNPIIYFDTLYEKRAYVIVSSFVTNEDPEDDNGNRFDYQNYIYFNDTWKFEDWKSELLLRTQFFTGIDFTEDDQYITLSTCSTEWEPSRHVIVARLLRDDESIETLDLTGWRENPNPKMPQIWYDYNGGGSWKETN